MSQLTDQVSGLRNKVQQAQLPPDLESNVASTLEEVTRLEGDIAARVHIEQLLRYIDWVVNLPWNIRTDDQLDLVKAQVILNEHHYGLQPVKDRILEYLAVLKLKTDEVKASGSLDRAMRAPIVCFVGLVGTGKTTIAKSIAAAMGRRFVRIPFGGMSDALDLRGQSRVRPDAEIGQVMKGLRFAGSKNPVILLDEIDRVAEHARGDIMGVLVELLDPGQNVAFTDHYLGYPFDLSEVLFIATANNTTNIATAVLDRLEPIQMPSYSDEEKIAIAKDYVLPNMMKQSGLSPQSLEIDPGLWPLVVRPLGYDAGIRSLERTINSICRKVARLIVEGKGREFHINHDNIKEFVQMY